MAFEFQKRRLFNPATIGVNRGRALERAAQQQGAAGFNLSEGLRRFVDNTTAETKKYEEERSKKLGAGATIVYEDITYTGADGIERTRKIAKNYKTPENLLGTSWGAVTFDEEAAKAFSDAALGTANEILNMEKELSKENSRFDQDVAEVTSLFDANISEPIAALRETIPNEFKNIFDSNVKTNIERTRSAIADRQYNKILRYGRASFNKSAQDYDDQFGSLFAGDPTEGLKLLEELKKEADQKALKGIESAHIWSTQLYKPYQLMLNAGVRAQRFLQIDYDSVDSLAQTHSNIKNLELLFNFQGQKVSLVNADGETESITLKDLGLDGTDNQIARNKVMSVLSKQRTLITDLYSKKNIINKNLNYIKNTKQLQASGLDYSIDEQTLSAKSDKIAFSQSLIHGTEETKELVTEYLAIQDMKNTNLDEDNIYTSLEGPKFRNYLASKYHTLTNEQNLFLSGPGNDIAAQKKQNPEGLLTRKPEIIRLLTSEAWLNATSGISQTENGTVVANNIFDKIPQLSADAQDEFDNLLFAASLTSSAEEAADLYIRNAVLEPKANDVFFKEIYDETSGAISLAIEKVVSKEFSDVNFGADNILGHNFYNKISRQVKINLAQTKTKKSIESETLKIMNRLIKNEDYGFSEYSFTYLGSTDDADEIDYDNGKVFTRYSTDKYFNTHPSRLPIDKEPVYDPLTLMPLYDENYLKHIEEYGATGTTKRNSMEKTALYYEIQNEIIEKANLKNIKNKQFAIEEELILGKNLKLVSIGQPVNADGVVYQVMYLPNPDGSNARPMTTDGINGANIQYTRQELERRSANNNTNIDKHIKTNLNFGKTFTESANILAKQFSPLYKGR